MTGGPRRRSRVALAVGLSALFALFAHLAIAGRLDPAVGAALSAIPVALLLAWMVRRHRVAGFVLAAIALAAAILLWQGFQRHFPDLFFVEHAGMNLALAWLFGHTLVEGREPLCTRFARIIHGGLPAGVAAYTRGVTLAWTLFFLAMFATSSALYLGAYLEQWSFFANLLAPVLVAAMFVVEYAVRVRVLPEVERVGILGGIRAFSRHMAAARFEANR